MGFTFLQKINSSLKRVKSIQGSSGELSSFTDSARQSDIDTMIRCWNDAIGELYKDTDLNGELKEGTITLVDGTVEYTLASDFIQMVGNPIDGTNDNELLPYNGDANAGYLKLRSDRKDASDYQGRPRAWVLNPTNGKLRLDATPTSSEAGEVYTYVYEKRLNLSATTDTFPFNDSVADALEPVAAQLWMKEKSGQFDTDIYMASMARAAGFLRGTKLRSHYGARRAAAS